MYSLQATDNKMASLTDRFSYLQPLKAKLPSSKQKTVTPTVKTFSAVSATPTKSQQSSSVRNSFSFSPDNASKACSSTPTKPQLASLPVESSYYHEVDSDFLDFDSWSPVNMPTPLSPPDRDIQGMHSNPPQSSSHRREASNTVRTTAKSIPPIRTDQSNDKQFTKVTKDQNNNNKLFTKVTKDQNNNNNKQFTNVTKQANTKMKIVSAPKNDPCSFFTAGSTK